MTLPPVIKYDHRLNSNVIKLVSYIIIVLLVESRFQYYFNNFQKCSEDIYSN